MAKAATAKSLKNGFEKHLKETEAHVKRVEQVFKGLKVSPGNKTCKAMQGLIEEGDHASAKKPNRKSAMPRSSPPPSVSSTTKWPATAASALTPILGNKAAAKTLQKTLDRRSATDKKLTQLASRINVKAEVAAQSKTAKNSKPMGKRILEAVGLE